MLRSPTVVLAGLILSGTVGATAMAEPVASGPRDAVVTQVNSIGWGSRVSRDRYDDEGYVVGVEGDPRFNSEGYGPGYGEPVPPGYAIRRPFHGVPDGFEPDEPGY